MVIRLVRDTLLGLVGDQPQQCVNGFFSTGSIDLDKIAKALGVDASELIESVPDENQAK
jgi:hypothetical protein